MLVSIDSLDKMTCAVIPIRGDQRGTCLGDHCMMWRWADMRRTIGYCGYGGIPLHAPDAGSDL